MRLISCDYIAVSTKSAYPAHRATGQTAVKMPSFFLHSQKPVLPIKYASASVAAAESFVDPLSM